MCANSIVPFNTSTNLAITLADEVQTHTNTIFNEHNFTYFNNFRNIVAQQIISLVRANPRAIDEIHAPFSEPFIHVAVRYRDIGLIEYLIRTGANINIENEEHHTAFYLAAAANDAITVNVLKTLYPNFINKKNSIGNPPVHQALCEGRTDVAKLLFNLGALPNKYDDNGYGPIHVAALMDNIDYIIYIVKEDPLALSYKDRAGDSALHLAVLSENFPLASALIKLGSNIYVENNEHKSPINYINYCENEGTKLEMYELINRCLDDELSKFRSINENDDEYNLCGVEAV